MLYKASTFLLYNFVANRDWIKINFFECSAKVWKLVLKRLLLLIFTNMEGKANKTENSSVIAARQNSLISNALCMLHTCSKHTGNMLATCWPNACHQISICNVLQCFYTQKVLKGTTIRTPCEKKPFLELPWDYVWQLMNH